MKRRAWLCGIAVAVGCAAAVFAAEDIPWVCKMADHPAPVQGTEIVALSSAAADFDASWWCAVASQPTELSLARPGLCIYVW